jgi:hypothetical protein
MQRNAPLQIRTRRQLQTPSPPPSASASPSDSGYGSASASPSAPGELTKENGPPLVDLWMHGDGNSDDPFVDSDLESTLRETTRVPYQTSRRSERKLATLPKRSPYSRPTLPASFYPGSGARLQQRGPGTGPLRHPDRFIPARPQGAEPSERFRTSKAPYELTVAEKLLRHNGATEDAFCYRRRTVTPLASEFRAQSNSESTANRIRGQSSNTTGPRACLMLTVL